MKNTKTPKRTIKDSLFTNLFSDKKYTLRLYKSLYKDDKATIDDIDIITINNVLVDDIYNDLGFKIKDKIIIMTESQSTYTPNIALRMLFYYCETIKDYIISSHKNLDNLYYASPVKIPGIDFYMIYVGKEKKKDHTIRLSQLMNSTKSVAVEVTVKVIAKKGDDIMGEYMGFCDKYTQNTTIYQDKLDALKKTIKECKEEGILKEYLEEKETEVINMYSQIFDAEKIEQAVRNRIYRESREEGIELGREEGIELGREEGREEGIELGMEKGMVIGIKDGKMDIARRMITKGMNDEDISELSGLELEEVISLRQEMKE